MDGDFFGEVLIRGGGGFGGLGDFRIVASFFGESHVFEGVGGLYSRLRAIKCFPSALRCGCRRNVNVGRIRIRCLLEPWNFIASI